MNMLTISCRVLFRKLSKGEGGGGDNWRNLDFRGGGGGGKIIKDVTKFHNIIWGVGICLSVCVCAGFHTGF